MREIKFRGRRVDSGIFIFGSLIIGRNGHYIVESKAFDFDVESFTPEYHREGIGCGVEDRNLQDRYDGAEYGFECGVDQTLQNIPEFIAVIPETVGQYIGLKDKNSKEIYKGDIIIPVDMHDCNISFWKHAINESDNTTKGIPLEIKWDIDMCGFDTPANIHYWEIIGNVHENLELLKEVK